MTRRRCWFAALPDAGPCDGELRKCHLIPKQVIRREVGLIDVYDERTWVWGCGGITGCSGHHGALDTARTLRIPRDRLPRGLIDFAEEFGLMWWIEREYR